MQESPSIKEMTRAGSYKLTWIKLRYYGEEDCTNPTDCRDAYGFDLIGHKCTTTSNQTFS